MCRKVKGQSQNFPFAWNKILLEKNPFSDEDFCARKQTCSHKICLPCKKKKKKKKKKQKQKQKKKKKRNKNVISIVQSL